MLANFVQADQSDNDCAVLPPEQRIRLDHSALAREQIILLRVLNVDFYPRESHLITFRDPWSFPTLFHPACNQLVRRHMDELAQKVCSFKSIVVFERIPRSADDPAR